jgi:hypothetical protein
MKPTLALLMLLPLFASSQEIVDKVNTAKSPKFELWASVGYGNSTPLKVKKLDPNYMGYAASYDKYYSTYLKSNYTPVYSLKVGVKLSQRISVGIRCNIQTVLYQYEQKLPTTFFPSPDFPLYQNNDRYFGNPMLQLGAYGKYVLPLGKFSPYLSLQTSWVHSDVKVTSINLNPGSEQYNAIGYGGALGTQYQLTNRLHLTAQAELIQMQFGNNYSMSQKSMSLGMMFLF